MNPIAKTVIALLFAACSCMELERVPVTADGPVTVGFSVSDDAATKSVAGADGLATSWTSDDSISLWAQMGTGFTLSAVPFSVYGITDGRAFFTAELDTPMADGTYTYYATCPVPSAVNGTMATFIVPSCQDGLSGGGEDIMVAAPVISSALAPVDWLSAKNPELNLAMDHKLHRLRFYASDSRLNGEPIQKLILSFPRNVVGTVETDFTDPDGTVSIKDGESVITVVPDIPVALSSSESRSYAMSSIVPTKFESGESLHVKLYTESKVASATISLQAKNFAAGHSTPVRIVPTSVSNFCKIYVDVLSNNLGEPVQTITFTAPSGCKWSDTGSETFVYEPGVEIDAGHSFVLVLCNI